MLYCFQINLYQEFLSYYPLKQGLKLQKTLNFLREAKNFYPTIH